MDAELDVVDVSIEDNIAWATIDRADKHNALSLAVIDDLTTAVETLLTTDDVRLIVVRGAGERAFSAGADVGEFAIREASEQLEYNQRLTELCDLLDSGSKPTIAGVNGVAFGGGAELILACDMRVASTDAAFSEAEINVGVVPLAKRLIDTIGYGQAAELCLTGRTVDAQEGRELGLFNRVVEPEEFEAEIRTLADSVVEKTEPSVRLTKETLVAARDNDLEEATLHQLLNFYEAFETDEADERIQAFLERQ
ncbi:enoyl-CoA hydratase/isomerase family protein [Salinadaptatus halalkaliphilus]|uniref:Enoyl-CoA hydratase/isomerase family protein n=1 Tax=Salinadaptatus halalkaliphilus TaxID=2419781 RepID=A0A4S3TGP9_9EURY|nr:enoyl-CoA hydratase/isomerase family protein [Salinadaptatus halalkaliphilus]THE63022.1 enoyl-CoA hydratase/isomerase family protein [Salinadaptatus halalkaliphilus]